MNEKTIDKKSVSNVSIGSKLKITLRNGNGDIIKTYEEIDGSKSKFSKDIKK